MKKYLLLITLFLLSSLTVLLAQSSKLKELEAKRKIALQEIENTNQLLRDTKKSTSSLINRIKLISSQIDNRQQVVRLLEQEVSQLAAEEQKIADEIVVLKAELEVKKEAYAKAITSMMRNRQNDNKLLFVLSGKSLTESYRRFLYLRDYSNWRKRQADEILRRNELLSLKQDSLQLAKNEKTELLKTKTSEQLKLKEEEDNYQSEVNQAKKKEKELQRVLTQKKKQAQALDRQIEKLIAEEIERQEKKAREEREAAERKAKAESKGKVTEKPSKSTPAAKPELSTKENIKLSSNFESNKGKLPMPISGRYTITSRFGANQRSKYVTTSSSGIEIQSQPNSEAKAVFNGEVTKIISIPGYGTCILVRHGNYYTFYGNIDKISVKQGDKVATGQSLGTIFTDPDTNVAQMHFQLWQRKTKLNPELWLRK